MKQGNTNKPELIDFAFKEGEQYFWWASWYADILGYKSLTTLKPSIKRSMKVCGQLGISLKNNFIESEINGRNDIKLSKFACFLIALQADGRKPVVKRARAYFLNHLEDLNAMLDGQDYLSRMVARDQLSFLNKKMIKVARKAQVKDFSFFTNEGYLGMYNGTLAEVKQHRGVANHKSMMDFMGMPELAANIFRITLTIERLKYLRSPSEAKAAREHWKIGSQIRSIVKENTGSYPERLAISSELKLLQDRLKEAQFALNKETKKLLK